MKLNKNIGIWDACSTELDDIVYQLYLNEMKTDGSEKNPVNQCVIINIHNKYKIDKINRAYKIAEIIVRKEKLEILNEIHQK